MVNKFQNRLIGLIIIVIISVVLVPILLDGQKKHRREVEENIPIMPEVLVKSEGVESSLEPLTNQPPEIHDYFNKLSASGETDILPPDKKQKTQEEVAPQGKAFIIDLGILQNTKADEVAMILRRAGHAVFSVPVKGKNISKARLYVGPDTSKENLISLLPEIYRLSKLQGKISNYHIDIVNN